jgi:hypothetical protein
MRVDLPASTWPITTRCSPRLPAAPLLASAAVAFSTSLQACTHQYTKDAHQHTILTTCLLHHYVQVVVQVRSPAGSVLFHGEAHCAEKPQIESEHL